MADKQEAGLKSAFDLAMERLARRGETQRTLSAEQKKAIADIERETRARIAELEIMYRHRIAELQGEENAEKRGKLAEERDREIEKARSRGEERKERARREA